MVKNLLANAGDAGGVGFDPWVRKIPWSRKWQPPPVFSFSNDFKICVETQKTPNSQGNFEKKRTKLEVSHFLISNYITKLQ